MQIGEYFFLLNARKIRKFENKFANQHDLHSSTVFLSDTTFLLFRALIDQISNQIYYKKLNFSKLLDRQVNRLPVCPIILKN
jgi:hypothetical protein